MSLLVVEGLGAVEVELLLLEVGLGLRDVGLGGLLGRDVGGDVGPGGGDGGLLGGDGGLGLHVFHAWPGWSPFLTWSPSLT